MARKMGVKEFRDNFTTIVREAKGPVTITNHGKVVGWFTPARRPTPRAIRHMMTELEGVREAVIARGIDVDARLKELGLDELDPPWLVADKPKRK